MDDTTIRTVGGEISGPIGLGARALGRGKAGAAYRLCLAGSEAEVREAQGLRFRVFNLELNEGLESSFWSWARGIWWRPGSGRIPPQALPVPSTNWRKV